MFRVHHDETRLAVRGLSRRSLRRFAAEDWSHEPRPGHRVRFSHPNDFLFISFSYSHFHLLVSWALGLERAALLLEENDALKLERELGRLVAVIPVSEGSVLTLFAFPFHLPSAFIFQLFSSSNCFCISSEIDLVG